MTTQKEDKYSVLAKLANNKRFFALANVQLCKETLELLEDQLSKKHSVSTADEAALYAICLKDISTRMFGCFLQLNKTANVLQEKG